MTSLRRQSTQSRGSPEESHVRLEYSSAWLVASWRTVRIGKILARCCTASETIGSPSQTRCITKPTPLIPARSSLTRTNLRLINPRNWINGTAGTATLVDAGWNIAEQPTVIGKIIKIFLSRATGLPRDDHHQYSRQTLRRNRTFDGHRSTGVSLWRFFFALPRARRIIEAVEKSL